MKTIKLLALLFISSLAFTSCSSDDDHNEDDDHDHEEEVITHVIYTLTNNDDVDDVVTLTLEDLDGEGGNDATYEISGPLTANSEYTGEITLRNETDEDDAEHIQEEVEEEGEHHEFFYTINNIDDLEIEKTDDDEDGNPLGFDTTVTTGEAGTGTITVQLVHEPTKPNDGTSANAGGSTDVQAVYSIEIEAAENEMVKDGAEQIEIGKDAAEQLIKDVI